MGMAIAITNTIMAIAIAPTSMAIAIAPTPMAPTWPSGWGGTSQARYSAQLM